MFYCAQMAPEQACAVLSSAQWPPEQACAVFSSAQVAPEHACAAFFRVFMCFLEPSGHVAGSVTSKPSKPPVGTNEDFCIDIYIYIYIYIYENLLHSKI